MRIDLKEFSREAVQKFIRFLNGYDLDEKEDDKDWKNDLGFIKELIVLSEVYGASDCQTAVAPYLIKHLNSRNAQELLDFALAHNAVEAAKLCKKVTEYEEPQSIFLPLAVIELIIALILLSYMS